jgi:hypothetical protein
MRVQFDLNLAAIAGGENYSEVVFNLIVWAEAQGRIDELIDKALADRPGNPDLRLAATQVRSGTGPTQPYARTVGTAIGSPPDRTMLRHVLVDQFNLEELRT